MRAGLWFQRKTWDEYRKYTTILFDCVLGTPFGSWARFLRWRTSSGPWKMKGGRNWWERTKQNVILVIIIIIINWIQVMEIMDEFCDTVLPVVNQLEQVWMSSLRSEILRDANVMFDLFYLRLLSMSVQLKNAPFIIKFANAKFLNVDFKIQNVKLFFAANYPWWLQRTKHLVSEKAQLQRARGAKMQNCQDSLNLVSMMA